MEIERKHASHPPRGWWSRNQLDPASFCSKTEFAFPPPGREPPPVGRNIPIIGSQQIAVAPAPRSPCPGNPTSDCTATIGPSGIGLAKSAGAGGTAGNGCALFAPADGEVLESGITEGYHAGKIWTPEVVGAEEDVVGS